MNLSNLKEVFDKFILQLNTSKTSKLIRSEALECFLETGYPDRKNEDWRYTDLNLIASEYFNPMFPFVTPEQSQRAHKVLSKNMIDAEAPRLIFINGQSDSSNQALESLGEITVTTQNLESKTSSNFSRNELFTNYPLAALNTAFSSNETVISVPNNEHIKTPLHLIYISIGEERNTVQPKLIVELGEKSKLSIVQHFLGIGSKPNWTNSVTFIKQNKGSILNFYRLQEYQNNQFHTELFNAKLTCDAHLNLGYTDLGGKLVRNDTHIELTEPGSACNLSGVFLAMQGQHIDTHTRIEHRAPFTSSKESFRGIIGEHGRGVFKGKVVVHKNAKGTDAQQSNDNLLLSENGEIDTKPELEIYTDDVKCSHGTTIGELDTDQLFYLCSRGVDKDTAKGLLTFAFANAILQDFKVKKVKEHATSRIAGELPDYTNWGGLL